MTTTVAADVAPTPVPVEIGPAPRRLTDEERRAELEARRRGDLGFVHSWELVTAVDGPGLRMTLFLTGCPLRCRYCQNPDTWITRDGTPHTVDEVMARIGRYRSLFRTGGGGVTISGGEPLMQLPFTRQILRRCHELGIHTALDTSGFLGARADDDLLDDVDLVLLDVKSGLPDTYRRTTGRELAPTLEFGRRLATRGTRMWIRFVLVPGLTDAPENVSAVADHVAGFDAIRPGVVERIEVLPFHQMGRDKWHRLGRPYQLEGTEPPSAELTERVRERFRATGITVY